MPGQSDGTICKVSEMNKELPEISRRKFFPLPPPPTKEKFKLFKFPRTQKEKLYNPDLQNRSKPQPFHGRVRVSVSNKSNNSPYKEKKELHSCAREGWVVLIIEVVVPLPDFLSP